MKTLADVYPCLRDLQQRADDEGREVQTLANQMMQYAPGTPQRTGVGRRLADAAARLAITLDALDDAATQQMRAERAA